jgi:hypothetical protein
MLGSEKVQRRWRQSADRKGRINVWRVSLFAHASGTQYRLTVICECTSSRVVGAARYLGYGLDKVQMVWEKVDGNIRKACPSTLFINKL